MQAIDFDGRLQRRLFLSQAALTPLRQGLLDREPDPDDGRAMLLQLTRKGKAVRSKVQAAWQETVAGVLVNWKPADISEFAVLLDRFASDLASFEDADEV